MKGYVAHKGDRWYVVIYEGLDTGKERRRWYPAGPTARRPNGWHNAGGPNRGVR